MPNDARARRDKRKKKAAKESEHLRRKRGQEDRNSDSSSSEQGDNMDHAAKDISLSSLASLSQGKGSTGEEKHDSPSSKEEEEDSSQSDSESEVIPVGRPLAPSQFVGTLMKSPRSKAGESLAQAAPT